MVLREGGEPGGVAPGGYERVAPGWRLGGDVLVR